MNPAFAIFAGALLVAQLTVPRRYIYAPILVAVCQIPYQQGVEIIGFNFTAIRLLFVAGLCRAFGERVLAWTIRHPLDRLMALFCVIAVFTSLFHRSSVNFNPLTVAVTLSFDYMGLYLFGRAYLRNSEDLLMFSRCLAFALIPLALFMLVEKLTRQNLYSFLGAIIQEAWVREGRVRATGPFGVAILSGTAGATSLALIVSLYRASRKLALVGIAACIMIVICSASSGPMMSLLASAVGLTMWYIRGRMREIKGVVIILLFALALAMEAPVWFIIARIDLAGGSTSWHRAELIDQAFKHLGDWWLVGTDYTRHWMPYGIEWSEDQSDITNHYINLGVRGGLPLMVTFILILFRSFKLLGGAMQKLRLKGDRREFLIWSLGVALFSHAVSFVGISYFDQSTAFLCLALGAIPGISLLRESAPTLDKRYRESATPNGLLTKVANSAATKSVC
jgi:hypothetical protein